MRLSQGHYGNAIISRFALTGVEHIDLSVPFKKRRRALVASCRVHNTRSRRLLLLNLHLGLAGFERALQVQRILASDRVRTSHAHTPVILGGDYNDVYGTLGARFLEPGGFTAVSRRARTFPAAMPMQSLDNIYFRGDLQLDHSFPCRRRVARQASDHLPLIADFDLL